MHRINLVFQCAVLWLSGCRRPVSRDRCVRNNKVVRTTRRFKLVRGRCRVALSRRVIRRVACPRNRVIKGRCNRRTRRQIITIVYYNVRRCRCYRRIRRKPNLCYCGPRTVRYGRCNRRTCKQNKVFIIRVGPVRGRCITERRVRKLRCCCKRNYTRRFCNRRKGYVQIYTYRFTFVRRTRRCVRRVSVRTLYKRCPRSSRRVYPCRGYFRKIVTRKSIRVRRLCRCKTVVRVYRRRCKCPPNRWLKPLCSRGRILKRLLTYRLRRQRCIRRIRRYYSYVKCSRRRRIARGKCSRACRRLVTIIVYVRNNRTCKCRRRVRRFVRLCCCKSSKNKRCVRGNRVVTTTVRRRLNRRRTRCVPSVARKVKMIRKSFNAIMLA